MAAKSKMEKYKEEIKQLIQTGISTRSAWKIINSKLHDDGKISYNAFSHFVNRHLK